MIHIHPFPARMAPEIALNGLKALPKDYVVLDPMSGSGMVLGTAAKLGLKAVGYDLDPLACLISKTNGRRVREKAVRVAAEKFISQCQKFRKKSFYLSWLDTDEETQSFIDFWFAPKQQEQLRVMSHFLVEEPFIKNSQILDILKIAMSRLIVTKEPKASLASDTAHSRPHRTIEENDFDLFNAYPKSVSHLLSALNPSKILSDVRNYRGDARKLGRTADGSIDCIVTSPPYLNAIDYMRGHRLSLVWLGYRVSELRKIRARSVGAEVINKTNTDADLERFLSSLHDDIDKKKRLRLKRYYRDLCGITGEAFRVLKNGRVATYVIGNSTMKGHEIPNSDLMILAARKAGFCVKEQHVRDIPENKRYMPLVNSTSTSLSKRMREEHIIVFEKRG